MIKIKLSIMLNGGSLILITFEKSKITKAIEINAKTTTE